MKALQIILTLSIISNFSIHSMNLILHKSLKKITRTVTKEKTKQFFNMNDINNLASAGSILITSVTGNPLYLAPIIPQMLCRTSTYLHMQKKSPTQFEQDLKFLLENQPNIIHQLTTINTITHRIKTLKEESDLLQLDRLNLLTEHQNKIIELGNNKTQSKLSLIEQTSPLFKVYNVSECLENYKNTLDLEKSIKALSIACCVITIPYLISLSGLTGFATSALLDCIIGPVHYDADHALLVTNAPFIFLSTGIVFKNLKSLGYKIEKANAQHSNFKYATEILEIYQNHMNNQKQSTMSNE